MMQNNRRLIEVFDSSSGIKSFKRQLTKEEKDKKGFSFGDDAGLMDEDLEDVTKIKDDLESTKQLLELEVRSLSSFILTLVSRSVQSRFWRRTTRSFRQKLSA